MLDVFPIPHSAFRPPHWATAHTPRTIVNIVNKPMNTGLSCVNKPVSVHGG